MKRPKKRGGPLAGRKVLVKNRLVWRYDHIFASLPIFAQPPAGRKGSAAGTAPGSHPHSVAVLLPYLGPVTPPLPCCKTVARVLSISPQYCEGVFINISKVLRSPRNGCCRGKQCDQQITGSPVQTLHRGAAHAHRRMPGKKIQGCQVTGKFTIKPVMV